MPPHDLPLALFRPPIILLVEDRPASRSPTSRLLGMLGYEVRGARTGGYALGLLRHHGALFDLIVANIQLPDMDGGELLEQVRLEEPGIRLAWIADYAPIGKAAALIAAHPEVPVLKKPFGFRELRDAMLPLVGPARAAVPLQGGLRFPRRRERKTVR
jgi:CheY-like chemotaxis protein